MNDFLPHPQTHTHSVNGLLWQCDFNLSTYLSLLIAEAIVITASITKILTFILLFNIIFNHHEHDHLKSRTKVISPTDCVYSSVAQ